jgi:leucyl-tRNA synthetase
MNHFSGHVDIQSHIKRDFIKIIAPLVPHIAEELWEINGGESSVFLESFPVYDKLLAEEDTINIAVQVNGKLRGNIEVVKTINNEDLLTSARAQENVSIHLKDKEMIKEIVVPQRLVNFVVK